MFVTAEQFPRSQLHQFCRAINSLLAEADFDRWIEKRCQRIHRAKGKQLQKRGSEVCERTFAHVCETGGMRRSWLESLTEVTKRYLLATAAHNLGRVMWKLLGVGKPR